MKKDIDKMLKCRAIFLQSIATIFDEEIVFNETFGTMLEEFFNNNIRGNFDKFSLIYCFKLEKGRIVLCEEDEEWEITLRHYLDYFMYRDDKHIIKLYDDVGYEAVDKISELAEMFYNYVNEFYGNKELKLKS